MIVCKFGGSSVASVKGADNIKRILSDNNNRNFVVVSAIGKSEVFTKKVTDELCECFLCCQTDKSLAVPKLDAVIKKYIFLSQSLRINVDLLSEKHKIVKKIEDGTITKDYLISRGEYLSALLYSKWLNAIFLDAKDYIIFNKNRTLNFKSTRQKLNRLSKKQRYVMGGFYGATKNGEIITFPRGGSDITGAVVSKALNVEVYENYTDVNGVYNKNPNLFENAQNMPILNYKTACQMADCGNEVVHKSALYLLRNSNTILIVKNTNNYNGIGSVVVDTSLLFSNLFICVTEQNMLIFQSLSKKTLAQLKHMADVKNVVYLNNKYFILLNNVHVENSFLQKNFQTQELISVCKFCIFSNVKINKKYIKIIKKIQKLVKKHAIFANFLAFDNNFVILCKKEDKQKIISILNYYLQN